MGSVSRWSYAVPVIVVMAVTASLNLTQKPNSGPPTGKSLKSSNAPSVLTMKEGGYEFEVHLDPNQKNVSIYTLSAPTQLPRSMSFSILRDKDTGETYELNAVEPWSNPGLPKYSGNVDLWSGSYMGFELQFPLPFQHEWKRIKAETPPTS